MVKIKSSIVVSVLTLSLLFIFPAFCNAQIAMDEVFAENTIINGYHQTTNNESKKTSITKEKTDVKSEKKVNSSRAQKDEDEEDEQDMMDKALDLLEVADNYWKMEMSKTH